ncbi:hypothetical protein ANCCAN_21279, partial [Ancylostoma caninum]
FTAAISLFHSSIHWFNYLFTCWFIYLYVQCYFKLKTIDECVYGRDIAKTKYLDIYHFAAICHYAEGHWNMYSPLTLATLFAVLVLGLPSLSEVVLVRSTVSSMFQVQND